jgi:hypothetical protein
VGIALLAPADLLEDPHPAVDRIAVQMGPQVLQQVRHAAQGTLRQIRRGGLGAGALELWGDDGGQPGVDLLGAGDGRLD